MASQNTDIRRYTHLSKFPRADEALHMLKKVASLVKPIMRARKWKVSTLSEFYPAEGNLLGINKNRGEQICLRLRYAADHRQFLPYEQVVDTMLHELSHNVFGPHDAKFNALWNQLRSEYEGLLLKGYTGEGFLGEGRRLGGRKAISIHEARRIACEAAAAAEKRLLNSGSGRRLGGFSSSAYTNIRDAILDAVQRRSIVLDGCGAGRKSEREIVKLANQATKNGFSSQAEEDEANERAIAQALWELVQEDRLIESRKDQSTSSSTDHKPSTRQIFQNTSQDVIQRLKTKVKDSQINPVPTPKPMSTSNSTPQLPKRPSGWNCPICTLHNPQSFLMCNACNAERPIEITQQLQTKDANMKSLPAMSLPERMWTCSRCTMEMEDRWWTCSACGKMKDSS